MDDRTVVEVAVSMRALLAAIDAGEVAASKQQRAYLTGATDALDEGAGDRSEP